MEQADKGVNPSIDDAISELIQKVDWNALDDDEYEEYKRAYDRYATTDFNVKHKGAALDARLVDLGLFAGAVIFAGMGEFRIMVAFATIFVILVLRSLYVYTQSASKNELAPIRLVSELNKLVKKHPIKKTKRAR